jgi:hypothetical protein
LGTEQIFTIPGYSEMSILGVLRVLSMIELTGLPGKLYACAIVCCMHIADDSTACLERVSQYCTCPDAT